jgi:hypothetical protein
MRPLRFAMIAPALAGVLVALGILPSVAGAHGPVAPVGSSYVARVSGVPAGFEARVIDGDASLVACASAQDGAGVGLPGLSVSPVLALWGGDQSELGDVLPEPDAGRDPSV